jgi:hypothetical protein
MGSADPDEHAVAQMANTMKALKHLVLNCDMVLAQTDGLTGIGV